MQVRNFVVAVSSTENPLSASISTTQFVHTAVIPLPEVVASQHNQHQVLRHRAFLNFATVIAHNSHSAVREGSCS
jgi:hypothetical protein